MKKTIWITTILCAALAVAPAGAQSQPMSVDVPFDFIAGPKTLAAGTYEVYGGPAASAILLRSADAKAAVFVLTNAVESRKMLEKGKLVFRKYGNTYFLAEVWRAGGDRGRELRPSPAEREIARSGGVQIAAVSASAR